jgi:hypothetical protein
MPDFGLTKKIFFVCFLDSNSNNKYKKSHARRDLLKQI